MKHVTCTRFVRRSTALLTILAIAMLSAASAPAIERTNSIPYANNFETLGTIISTAPLGWSGADTNFAVSVSTNYTAPGGFPLAGSAHTAAVELNTEGGTITNLLTGSDNTNSQYWIDTNIRMVSSESAPTSVTNDNEIQVAIYLNASSNLVVYHAMPDDTGSWTDATTNYWTTLSHTPIANDSWHRLTVQIDYFETDNIYGLDHEFFRIMLDGTAISNTTNAWQLGDLEAGAGGEWFLCANSASDSNRVLKATLLSGTGHFDDFVVTNGAPTQATFYTNGVPDWWLTNYNLELDNSSSGAVANADNDMYVAWEEWLLGTHPSVSNSFQLLVESDGDTNTLIWVTDALMDGSAPGTILIKKSTNLVEGYTSTQSVSRSTMQAGTNAWPQAGGDAMYRLGVKKY